MTVELPKHCDSFKPIEFGGKKFKVLDLEKVDE